MKKAKNWCITRVVLVVEQEYLDEVLELLDMPQAEVEYAYDNKAQIHLGVVVSPAFAGTRQALLDLLKRTDDLLFDKRDALQRARELCAYAITEVNLDYLYDPMASGDEKFEYFCFGTDSFLLITDSWGEWVPWDGFCWDTRHIGERMREDLKPMTPNELREFLDATEE